MAAEKHDLVVKSNRLVEASYRLSMTEQQLILYAICRSREEQLGLSPATPIRIDAQAFAKQFNVDQSNVYGMLSDACDALLKRRVSIEGIDSETGLPSVTHTHWIEYATYVQRAGFVKLAFSSPVIPFITRLETEFTSYRIEKIGHMTSIHAVRLYELLVQHLSIGKREMQISWLKEKLGISDEYPRLFDLKKYVLNVAEAQINEHSDITVSHTQRKTGRTVTHLVFDIKARSDAKPAKKPKRPVVDDAYVKKHARPGESYDQALRRLLEDAGQGRLVA